VTPTPTSQPAPLVRLVQWTGRLLIILLLAYAPWFYGMFPWDQLVVLEYWTIAVNVLAIVLVLLPKGIECGARLSFALLCLSAMIVLAVIQVLPLPQVLYEQIAPTALIQSSFEKEASLLQSQALDGNLIEERQPFEQTISVYPTESRACLIGLCAAATMLLASGLFFSSRFSRLLLLCSLAAVSTAFAVLGIFQNVSWQDWTLLPMPHVNHFSTFVNRNAGPQFLAIGLGCILSLLSYKKKLRDKLRSHSYQRRYPATNALTKVRHALEDMLLELDTVMIVLLLALVIHLVGVVAAASRGGIVAMFFAMAISILFYLSSRRRVIISGALGFTFVALVAYGGLILFDFDDRIAARMQDLDPQNRFDLWKNSLADATYWLTGTGLGTFRFVIMPHNPVLKSWPHHAENIYIEIAVEFGLIGIGIVLLAILQLWRKLIPAEGTKSLTFWPATVYAVAAICIHGCFDFSVLIIPAIYMPLAAIIGTYLAELDQPASSRRRKSRRKHRSGTTSEAASFYKAASTGVEVEQAKPLILFRFATLAIAATLLLVLRLGHHELQGFVQASQIQKIHLQQRSQIEPKVLVTRPFLPGVLSTVQPTELNLAHPEVLLEITKIKCLDIETQVRQLANWPVHLPIAEQKQLSSIEFISAILRSNSSSEKWLQWREFFLGHPTLEKEIDACYKSFCFGSKSCPIDWRFAWGRFQTQPKLPSSATTLNWYTANRLCRTVFNTQEVMGTCSLIAGDRKLGIRSWRDVVAANSKSSAKLAALIGNILTVEEILEILPSDPYATAHLAKSLSVDPQMKDTSGKLIDSSDLARFADLATTAEDWDLTAWVAEQQSNDEVYLASLQKIALLLPYDVPARVRLAKKLVEKGELQEAIRQLEQAARRTTLGRDTQQLLDELKKKAALPPDAG
jgi:O-antigen ligase